MCSYTIKIKMDATMSAFQHCEIDKTVSFKIHVKLKCYNKKEISE